MKASTSTPSPSRLAIIGGGNMGAALAEGLLRAGHEAKALVICETSERRREDLAKSFPDVAIVQHAETCSEAIIAVKPSDVAGACKSAAAAGAQRIVSIAAGVRISALRSACGDAVRIVRAMPNTPATVGLSATAVSLSENCSDGDRVWAIDMLSSVGSVVEIPEEMMDSFTGLVGSGPAYVFYIAEALREAAMAEGFDQRTSSELIAKMLTGSAALLAREPEKAAELRARVSSPNGTTAAGVAALDERQVREAFVAAVQAASRRSRELGDA